MLANAGPASASNSMEIPALLNVLGSVGIAVLGAAFSLLWWEVRQLRKAKHANAQVLQWLVICVRIISRKVDANLPEMMKDE